MAINLSTLVNQTNPIQLCKAWVNFNGATGAIRDSYNVSSVTVQATGQYLISFVTAFATTNFACVVGAGNYTLGNYYGLSSNSAVSTGNITIQTASLAGSPLSAGFVSAIIFSS